MDTVYHLNLTKGQIGGAEYALLPGDPFRCQEIADAFEKNYGRISWKREFCTCLAESNGLKIVITSTGVGGPSAAIAIEELAMLGVKTFVRAGTTGAIQGHIDIGDVIITTGSVRLDGTSKNYAPAEYPAVADLEITNALIEGARALNKRYHVGITASSDSFYAGQARVKDSCCNYIIRELQGAMEEWRNLKVLNFEMESSTLFTICSAFGLKAGCVTGVAVNRLFSDTVSPENLSLGEKNAIAVAVDGIKKVIQAHSV